MSLSDLETEDLALLVSIGVATTAAVVDTFYGSPIFKALKILSLFLSLGLAIHRIRTGKPFYKEVLGTSWLKAGNGFEIRIPKSEHKRGKFPHARCLVPLEAGGFSECLADAQVGTDGNIVVQVNTPARIRIEVRK